MKNYLFVLALFGITLSTAHGQTTDAKLRVTSMEMARQLFRSSIVLLPKNAADTSCAADPNCANKATDDGSVSMANAPTNSGTKSYVGGPVDFAAFLDQKNKQYETVWKSITQDTIPDVLQNRSKAEAFRILTMLKSGKCFNETAQKDFFWAKDTDGHYVVGYAIENLRKNARYGLVDNYKEGFARVMKDQVYGYLNLCGDEVIPAQYERAEPFNNGKALVKKFDWFFLDANNDEGAALENLAEVRALQWGFWWVKFKTKDKTEVPKVAIIDNNYEARRSPVSELYDAIDPFYKKEIYIARNGDKLGLINITGSKKLPIEYDAITRTNVPALVKITVNQKHGFIDTLGNILVKPIYDDISGFDAFGIATVREGANLRLFRSRDLAVSRPFLSIAPFDIHGLSVVKDANQQFGLMNTDLKIVKEPQFVSIGSFNEYGLAQVCAEANRCGFMRLNGTEIIPPKYDQVGVFNKSGMVVLREAVPNCRPSGGTALPCKLDLVADVNGRIIINGITEFEPERTRYELTDTLFSDNYLVVKALIGGENNVNYHLIDKREMKKITETPYESVRGYDANFMFSVRKDNRWGLMDTTGRVIARTLYKDMALQSEGYYAVKQINDKYGFIDRKGKPQIGFEYEDVKAFRNGIAIVSRGKNRVGIINRFGAKITPCVFKVITYKNSDQLELIDTEEKVFIVNLRGDCVSNNCTDYDEILRKSNQLPADQR